MILTFPQVANDPGVLTFNSLLPSGGEVIFRPLVASDVTNLATFLENLSPRTRDFYRLDSFNIAQAKKMCQAIGKYDKLRFIVYPKANDDNIIALFEFSFDIPESDISRFLKYGIRLDSKIDCRMGLCIADRYQNQGVGSVLFPHVVSIARKFKKQRIILWGGTFADNNRAIRFYKKHGFKQVGKFKDKDGRSAVDMILELTIL